MQVRTSSTGPRDVRKHVRILRLVRTIHTSTYAKAVSSGVGEESEREGARTLGRSRLDTLQMRHDDPQIRV